MKFHVVVQGETQTLMAFLAVQRGIVDLRKLGAWKQVRATFYKITKRLFDTEGSSGASGAWTPVTPATAAAKLKKWNEVRILRASGNLFQSMTGQGGFAYVDEQPQELTIGTTLPYAKWHQTGTGTMPARRPIDLTADDERQLIDPLKQKVKQLIANARLRDTRGF